jgi:uncharacterized membrane protein (DUF106 family)
MVKKERIVQQKKKQMKKILEVAAMGLGFFVMFISLIYREETGAALGVVLDPLAEIIGDFLITILILSVVTGIYTSLVQKYTTNWELMEKSKQYQKQMRELQKELMEAKREDNKHRLKKLEKKKAEIMRQQTQFSGEMMKQQMKPMAYIMIITLPIFMWIWVYIEAASVGTVIFPLIGEKEFTAGFILGLPYWVLWYMVCSIPIAQMIRKAIGIPSST